MTIREEWRAYDALCRETDRLYARCAQKCGVSDAAYRLLYVLFNGNRAYTQKELCLECSLPKQTVSSAMKELERRGMTAFGEEKRDRRFKSVFLTATGEEFSRLHIGALNRAEEAALSRMTEEERSTILTLSRKYLDAFRIEIEKTEKGKTE